MADNVDEVTRLVWAVESLSKDLEVKSEVLKAQSALFMGTVNVMTEHHKRLGKRAMELEALVAEQLTAIENMPAEDINYAGMRWAERAREVLQGRR